MPSFDPYTAHRHLEMMLFDGFGPDYYRWHDLPMPWSKPVRRNPGNRVRTLYTISYPILPDGHTDFAHPRYEYGDPERDALEMRLVSVLKSCLQQRQSSE